MVVWVTFYEGLLKAVLRKVFKKYVTFVCMYLIYTPDVFFCMYLNTCVVHFRTSHRHGFTKG